MKNLPNLLTGSRILLVFLFVFFANFDTENKSCIIVSAHTAQVCHVIAYVLAIIGGLTDLLDGYLARKYHLESDFGRLIDPLADKLFVMATFAMFVDYQYMPAWLLIVILAREFMVTGLRTLASSKGIVIAADKWGKIKTVSQMVTLAIGGFFWIMQPICSCFPDLRNHHTVWHSCWMGLLYFVAVITLFSGLGYFIKHKDLYLGPLFNEKF